MASDLIVNFIKKKEILKKRKKPSKGRPLIKEKPSF